MATNADELRAAAEYFATTDLCTCDPESGVTTCIDCDTAALARHYLATVPADDGEPVTVEKLEAWGGEPSPSYLQDDPTSRRFRLRNGDPAIRVVTRGGTWCVDHYVNGWRFLVDRNTVGQMRQTLEGLGIMLKGGA